MSELEAFTALLDATYAALDRATINGEEERDEAIETYEERCNE